MLKNTGAAINTSMLPEGMAAEAEAVRPQPLRDGVGDG